jgi:hypothetical protein
MIDRRPFWNRVLCALLVGHCRLLWHRGILTLFAGDIVAGGVVKVGKHLCFVLTLRCEDARHLMALIVDQVEV